MKSISREKRGTIYAITEAIITVIYSTPLDIEEELKQIEEKKQKNLINKGK